jgi:uncharacterized 2Fe-2S/4Fe-4S cluster protein (DUF4445 family)
MGERNDRPQLVLMPSGRRGRVEAGTNLLAAARALGVEIESICGGRQTCGKCQVAVESGSFAKHGIESGEAHLTPPGEVERQYCEAHGIRGRRLACATQVVGDVLINVPEESQARKQIIAKAATDRVIHVDPAVRQVYVQVPAARIDDARGDWQRLQEALAEQWQLTDLHIEAHPLRTLQGALRKGHWAVTVTLWRDRIVQRVEAGYAEGLHGLAVDVGTTSVVAHLCDLRTGAVLATESMMNPQVRFGEDLMSRVSYGMSEPQGVERMHRAIVRAVNELADRAARSAGLTAESILDAVLVGNTIMHHLLLGIDPVELGGTPFAPATSGPVDLRAVDLGFNFHPAARVHVLPCIAGHVGADHVAVLLAEAPQEQDRLLLVVDVGTNAEMSLGGRGRMLCASSPTGPAFEGAQITHGQRAAPGAIERVRIDPVSLEPRYRVIGHDGWITNDSAEGFPASAKATGICGSGIIEAVAELFLAGVLKPDGRFDEAAAGRSPRVRFATRSGEYLLVDGAQAAGGAPIVVTQGDVRAIQLAKAALYAGVKLLMQHHGAARVDGIRLAGAFGSYIDPQHAMVLGMIPDCALKDVQAVGNAAGDGARMALVNVGQRAEAARLARWVQHVQTATEAAFQDEFVAAIALPHARDAFPHLAEFLPAKASAGPRRRAGADRRSGDGESHSRGRS